MEAAIKDADITPSQIAHVNAHATSTPEGDPLEAIAIQAALGDAAAGCVVTSTKSMTGHLLGGSGAVEAVVAIKSLVERVVPPTINLEDLDENVTIDIATKTRSLTPRTDGPMAVLKNSFGFGGHNVALIFTEHIPAEEA
jgi:3-oxoacyl-[acyl-carrier-protein] synthase II